MSEDMKKGNTYRITVQTIGPEECIFNDGAPLIIECDGFCIIGDSGNTGNLVVHHISVKDIAVALASNQAMENVASTMVAIQIAKRIREARS